MAEETPYFFNALPNLLKALKGTQKEKENGVAFRKL
jgi:hypothetical protein